MRKSHWISLLIALCIAGLFGLLEQRRGHYFLDQHLLLQTPDFAANKAAAEKEEQSLDKKLAFLMQRWELATYDSRFKFRGDRKPHPDIVIIAIDEFSLKQLHQWPWPRSIHARLIRTLEA